MTIIKLKKKDTLIQGPTIIDPGSLLIVPPFAIDQHDWNPIGVDGHGEAATFMVDGIINFTYIVVDITANMTFTGIVSPSPAILNKIVMFNRGLGKGTLEKLSGSSLDENQLNFTNDAEVAGLESISLVYLPSESKWILDSLGEI